MRIRRAALFLLVLLLPAVPFGPSFADWAKYRPARLSEVVAAFSPGMDGRADYTLANRPVRARVVYKGKGRRITAATRAFILAWLKSHGMSRHIGVFHFEVLVVEDGREYWVPIQDKLAEDLRNDLALTNAPIDIYANFLGFNGRKPVFIINRFVEIRSGKS